MLLQSYLRWRDEQFAREDDPHKLVEQMACGLDILYKKPVNAAPLDALISYARHHRLRSAAFFYGLPVYDFQLRKNTLSFSSPMETETPLNNCVRCRIFEGRQRERAVIILPHWNASLSDYDSMGRCLRLAGITAVTITLPYHKGRRQRDAKIAGPMVSANLGLTIRSSRQAVLDARAVIDWLHGRGYQRIAVIGVSLGSSIASLVASHDPRVQALALVLMASRFGAVVWTGRATRHVRQALEGQVTLAQLNEIWSVVSPISYVSQLRERDVPVHVLSARDDTVFLPQFTREILDAYQTHGVRYTTRCLPCGHYTLGTFPFNVVVLVSVLRFLRDHLAR